MKKNLALSVLPFELMAGAAAAPQAAERQVRGPTYGQDHDLAERRRSGLERGGTVAALLGSPATRRPRWVRRGGPRDWSRRPRRSGGYRRRGPRRRGCRARGVGRGG